jgi:hypothetical protein
MTDMPPTRFRVVERGRRLEVIDTHQAGKAPPNRPVTPPRAPLDGAKSRFRLPEKLRFDGGGSWTTDSFYDAKGPRTLTLDAGAMQTLRFVGVGLIVLIVMWALAGAFLPILWGAPVLLFHPKVRGMVRDQATSWFDGLDTGV